MTPPHDPLLSALRELTAPDVDVATAERIRRRAHDVLQTDASRSTWSRLWNSLEPVMVLAVVVVFSARTLAIASALFAPRALEATARLATSLQLLLG